MTDRYAVIGNPVAHSRSPAIHAAFAAQTGRDLTYETLFSPVDAFADTARGFFRAGGHGTNVTVPFKQQAFAFVDQLSDRARSAGAVNTITRLTDEHYAGDNTDGAGLVRDLQTNLGLQLGTLRILILGAGGAAQGVLHPLLEQQPPTLVIANRTVGKAQRLAQQCPASDCVHATGFAGVAAYAPFDLVINATSAGLSGDTPALPDNTLAPGATAYDMLYGDHDTPFVSWAKSHGASRSADGYGMLVEQAAVSFAIWQGVLPDTRPLLRRPTES